MAKWSLKKYYGTLIRNAKGESYSYSKKDALRARHDEEAARSARGNRASRKHARNERFAPKPQGRT